MRASPVCQVTLDRFGWWRAGVGLLALLALLAIAAWSFGGREGLPALISASVLVVTLVIAASAALLMRCPALSLRWDTQCWHVGPPSSLGEEPWTGQIVVAVDFGGWMLLRFRRESGAVGDRATWIPVQRAGLGTAWHAFRCAVYSARPEPRGAATARPDAAE
jgi:hypothetical protein